MFDESSLDDNRKVVEKFGAEPIDKLDEKPDFYTFDKKLIYSHRDFDEFYQALKDGKKCAIVSGFNASGKMHIGHKAVFDTNLYFQREFDVPVFIPISDDESYISGKVESQEEALRNSLELAREMLAYGFDPKKTHIIVDQNYTEIYNFAVRLSRKLTMSEVQAAYGYKKKDNPGLFFYPAVQAAHVLFPLEKFDYDHVLVPIGPDEDSHLRIARDLADRFGYRKPAVLHSRFMPGIDGNKMSKSKDNYIRMMEDRESIENKVNRAYSGGADNVEEHRKKGGKPENDIPCFYLSKYFLSDEETEELFAKYRSGELLSGEVKEKLKEKLFDLTSEIREKYDEVTEEKVKEVLIGDGYD